MSQPEMGTETVEAVRFGIYTEEEVHKLSVKQITRPDLLNQVGSPEPGGLYDLSLGPLDDFSLCKTCGQRCSHCPGHFGNIDLVRLVYHPLLFNILYRLLQNACLFCYRFKASKNEVQSCVMKLNLIRKGDILGAKNLDSGSSKDNSKQVFNEGKPDWTSFQLTEAHAILNDFLKKRGRKCERCNRKNPVISKPIYGWLRLGGLSDENIRDNIIKGVEVNAPIDEDDGKPASEVENGEDQNAQKVALKTRNIKNGDMSSEWLNWKTSRSLLPSEIKDIVERLWQNEGQLCSLLFDIQQYQLISERKVSFMMFFLKTLLVPPPKFRPPTKGGDKVMEHPQTVLLLKILESNISLGKHEKDSDYNSVISRWRSLQESVNILFDSKSAAAGRRDMTSGICQLLEKKEGMFRQKMMGKRVNFACRSVISPDPYLAVNEIGIPPVFALKLTYPERVTPWNISSLRDAIVNGPEIHPGATQYVDKSSAIKLQPLRKSRIPISRKLPSSRGVLTKPGKNFSFDYEGKVVLRHLRNGDIVLVNRQPTLHKPSIIALKVRVLPGEKTIRFHYANCDSFNADFDGDEISVHFPQDEISRAEAYNIVNADNQYIVPTRGDPKRALIQDHIVGAVLLTKRDTFLTWDEFSELLCASGACSSGGQSLNGKSGKKMSILDSEAVIRAYPPALIRPRRLWTGKQVITAILNHVTKGSLPFTVKKRAKIAREYFGKDESKNTSVENPKSSDRAGGKKRKNRKMTDEDLIRSANKDSEGDIRNGSKRGAVVDPSQSVDEDVVFVYKNELVQGVIDKEQFGKFGLVHIIQEMYGSNAAGILLSVLSRVLTAYLQMHGFTCGVDDILLLQSYDDHRKQLLEACLNSGEEVHLQFIGREKEHLDPSEMQIEIEKAIRRNGESAVALLDGMMRSKLNTLSSAVTKLFPEALVKPFRKNCLSLMTLSGAKGGTFNFQQISLLLGQQELEGKRVPRMVSGKTLPCFPPWDCSARAGGFISDRYLTGLRPQEFYFHCMAGREGLVDTAVKTSRSGYLQRCLIKNLECLRVHYDHTVRDADGSIVQFRYGEDGVDVHLKNYLQEFEALAMNQQLIVTKNPLSQNEDTCLSTYIEEDNEFPDQLVTKAEKFSNDYAMEKYFGLRRQKDRLKFVKMVRNKYYSSLAQPGEPVGVIAAQSVGEPSTQMTLNTFHHAGRGEMNVTLGIPRLQEILMTASINIKTPTMTCPLLRSKEKDDADRLAAKLKRITIADLIENMEVSIVPFTIKNHKICSIYKLKVKLYEPELYPPHTDVTLEDCQETLQTVFADELETSVDSHLKFLSRISGIKQSEAKDSDQMDGYGSASIPQEDDEDDDIEEPDDLGLDAEKERQQAVDEIDYDEETEEGRSVAEHDSEVEQEHENGEVEQEHENGDVEQEHENGEVEKEHENGEVNEEHENCEDKNRKMKPDVTESLSRKNSNKQRGNLSAGRKKKNDLVIYNEAEGLYFEVHLMLIDEPPHILLAELAEKTAKKVYVKTAGKIEQCKVVELLLDDSETGCIPMLRNGKESRPALQTAGVDFAAFWDMQDEIDVRYISCNDVNAVLNTYGVEAARATIIKEIFTVFGHYGVSVDMRHLTLIADYMTHTGGYRPMSRSGGIAESVSPLSKMSYEQASKFLVQAASSGEVDNLETPSARLCLGLPAKVGTGCFDLMHHINM